MCKCHRKQRRQRVRLGWGGENRVIKRLQCTAVSLGSMGYGDESVYVHIIAYSLYY